MPTTTVELPLKIPGKCYNCNCSHNQDGRFYYDLHIDIPRYGRVYLCSLCLAEIARENHYVHESEIARMRHTMDQMLDAISELEDENGRLRSAVSSLDFVPRRPFSFEQELEDGSERSKESNGTAESSERRPSEPANVEGSLDLSTIDFGANS